MSKLKQNMSEAFALSQILSRYFEDLPFTPPYEAVLQAIEDESDEVVAWQPFEDLEPSELIELIENLKDQTYGLLQTYETLRKPKFEIQTRFGDMWENVWEEEGKPLTFDSLEEATSAVIEYVYSTVIAHLEGSSQSLVNPNDMRIREIPNES